jgi:hypothetical protein
VNIDFVVYKCTNGFGITDSKEIARYSDVEKAVEFHKEQRSTEFTWYEIGVEYE